MTGMTRRPVVVGVDGSESSGDALAWAARDAQRRRLPLRIVHALTWPLVDLPYGVATPEVADDDLAEAARRLLDRAAERARGFAPDIEVTTSVVSGTAPAVLIQESESAELVVLGSHGRGAITGMLIGSVSVHLAAHARCPAVVVRPGTVTAQHGSDAGQVVVGVDGSELSTAAIGLAFEEASLRRVGLTAVHAWDHASLEGVGVMLPLIVDFEQAESAELVLLSEALAGWRDKYPDVPIVQRIVRSRPAKALVEASAGAELLVLGSRGRGGFAGMLLGSVSLNALHTARCPVAIVRHHR